MTELLPDRVDQLVYWVREREAIRKLKEAGKPKPWTQDPILQGTRFCNVRRMDDKVSRWLLDFWYPKSVPSEPESDPGAVLAAAGLARLINWPDTLRWLLSFHGGPWKFELAETIRRLRFHRDAGNKIFTGAYIINAAGANGRDKIEVVCRQASTLLRHPELLDPTSMQSTHEKLMLVPGIGSFIAGQIVADLRHVYPGEWADKMTWAPLGPGSHRGVRWLTGWNGETKLSRMTQAEFEEALALVIAALKKRVPGIVKDRGLEAHDAQNCLCEYDKFMRLTHGTGRGKNKYPGAA